MKEVRCPKCGRLLGYFSGKGEVLCPKCRKNTLIYFDTNLKVIKEQSVKNAII